ncbi:MAG TPA: DinB family protein [Pyrinomonadaceae bacterium]|nr:DinB family protein [Pyrinomonadaceae bacterium]
MSNESDSQRFSLDEAVAVLARTPVVLSAMLHGLPNTLIRATEGEGTWSPYDVVGHLIHGERTDWIPRARHILTGESRPFDTFDRTAQFTASAGRTLADLLEEFANLRRQNLATLEEWQLGASDFARTGMHPELGVVTLGQLLATWVAHDLDHLGQVARTIAKRYTTNVGPWIAYLSILRDRR